MIMLGLIVDSMGRNLVWLHVVAHGLVVCRIANRNRIDACMVTQISSAKLCWSAVGLGSYHWWTRPEPTSQRSRQQSRQ
jgi:hypothetical protein